MAKNDPAYWEELANTYLTQNAELRQRAEELGGKVEQQINERNEARDRADRIKAYASQLETCLKASEQCAERAEAALMDRRDKVDDLMTECRRQQEAIEVYKERAEKAEAEVEKLRKAFPFHAWRKQKDEANAEISRLREALANINEMCAVDCDDEVVRAWVLHEARAALAPKEGE